MFVLKSFKKEDFIASLVVFIIAMPLSLGIALASGCTPAAGLITAVIGGIVVGVLAGAPLAVTGPAAGLSAIVFQLVQQYGISGLAIITVLCGIFQLLMGLLKAGQLFTRIPTPVLEGVLSAIGLIIVLGQLHVLVGAPVPTSPSLAALTFPNSLSNALGSVHGVLMVSPVFLCGLCAIAIQLAWTRFASKLRWIPGALPAVIFVTLLSMFGEMPRVQLAHFLPTIESSFKEFFLLQWLSSLQVYLIPAVGLAIVASAESLLTGRAIDILLSAHKDFRPCNLNKELIAQGSGNLLSGVIGGIPMTAVMVRSAANVNAGGQTRASTILHGIWIAAFVGFLPFVLTQIPLTALAAILILTGVRLINIKHFIHELKTNFFSGAVWFATAVAVFATDLLKGLVIGVIINILLYFIRRKKTCAS